MNFKKIKEKFNFKIDPKLRRIGFYVITIAVIVGSISYVYNLDKKYKILEENKNNMAFYQVIGYVQNAETYLAKATISTSAEQGVENLRDVWREASLAQSYLSQLPLTSKELGNTSKFLNQLSDYSYSLSRKNVKGESLTEEDISNLEQLHQYTVDLENVLNQLLADLNSGRIKWSNLKGTDTIDYATKVSSIEADAFSTLEESFHEYSGLIYDGAFSESINSGEKKGLTGDDIDEKQAQQIAEEYYGKENIEKIENIQLLENADIPAYVVKLKIKEHDAEANISISKKGGHIVSANFDKNVETEVLNQDQANEIGKSFLENHGYKNMKETYYLKENGIMTINYAYSEEVNGELVVIYPDLVKLKVALDDGTVTGLEASGFLNAHSDRDLNKKFISKEEAKKTLNKKLELTEGNLAIIPTEWNTEIFCWEFKGKVADNDFLVYINAETGKEEDILVIVNTPNGILTQ